MYSYTAFIDLDFMTRTGRLGPGFFPRIIGVLMVGFTLYAMVTELRPAADAPGARGYGGQVALIMGLGIAYVALLGVLGGVLATVLFLLVALLLLNPGRLVQNVAVALLVPVAIYILFDTLLNAAIPEGMLPLPF